MQEFFKGSSVFVTGSTGFVGKSVIEKLLRTVPSVHTVYILIRPKRGQSVNLRLQQLLQSPVFDRLKQENAGALEKIKPIVGDIGSPDLGISLSERTLLQEQVSVVIHSAATIKFNENLKVAININVRGTQRVVHLCKAMGNLKALVYVSTAYANCDLKGVPIQEHVYPPPQDSVWLLSKVDTMETDYLEENVKLIIGQKPNTYTYTKALAEYVLEAEVTAAGIPACIVRPSMITGAWKEPMPGWVEGFSGPVGLSLAMANGLLKIIFGDTNALMDTVPVDMVVNTILTAAWETGRCRPALTVYNCCSGSSNPITVGRYTELIQYHVQNSSPLCRAVWYPHVTFTLNRIWYETQCFLFHYVPACLMDLVTFLVSIPRDISRWRRGAETEMILRRAPKVVSLHRKIITAAKTVEHFSVNGWDFQTKNMDRLRRSLKELPLSEQRQWSSNFAEYSWEQYTQKVCHGMKTFLAKEAESTMALSKKRHERLRIVKKVCDTLGMLGLLLVAGIFIWNFFNIAISR